MTHTADNKLQKFIAFGISFGFISIVVDAGINTGYIIGGRASDGLSAGDIVLGIAFFCIWVMATGSLMKLGLEVLPYTNKEKRAKIIPIWVIAMFFVGAISVFMSVAQLGGDLARHEHATKVIQRTNTSAEDMIEFQRKGNNVQAIFRGAVASLTALHEAELQGNVCESGTGKGRCTGLLKNLLQTSQSSLDQLIELNGQADPIIESIRELQSDMRWLGTKGKDNLDYDQKAAMLRDKLSAMAQHIEALSQTLPTLPITRAMDSYNRNWAALGISDIGAKRIQTEVRPIAKRLKPILANLKTASHINIRGLEHKSEYELLANSTAVRPIIGIAILLAFLPMLISVCVLILTGKEPTEAIKIVQKPNLNQTQH